MAIKPNGTYALSFTTSSQVADPDNSAYQRIDLDAPPTEINGVVDVVGNVGRTLGFTFGGGITAEVDDPIIASGVNEAYTEWTDSGRWIIDDTNAWMEFTGLPPNSWCAFQWRAWKQQSTGYEQIKLNGAQHSYTHSSTSATNRNEQHRLVWIGADGKLRVEISVGTGATAPLSAIQISTRESLQGDTEYIGLFMKPYSGGVTSTDFITNNSLGFNEMSGGDPSAVGQDLTLHEGRTVLHDAFDNPTPYVIETVKDIWNHGASGMGGISYGGLYTGTLSGFANSRYTDGKSAFKIKNLPIGKRYRYFVTGENANSRDTDFWVNGEFQRYDASSLTTSTEIQTAVSHMLKFEGIVPASGELLVEWDARADTAATTYYGYHGHAYLMLEDNLASKPFGFNFSATTSGAGHLTLDRFVQSIDCENAVKAYPQAYQHDGHNSSSAGFVSTITASIPQGRDRAYAPDWRLASLWQSQNAGTEPEVFRVDLPKAGTYKVRLAAGDAGYTKGNTIRIKDNTVERIFIDDVATASNFACDATGTVHAYADWEANNQAAIVNFDSGVCFIECGGVSGSGNTALNYLEFEYVPDLAPSVADTPSPEIVDTAVTTATSSTSATITHRLDIQENDFLLAFVNLNDNRDITGFDGFTAELSELYSSEISAKGWLLSKVATANEPDSYTFGFNNQVSRSSIILVQVRGVDTSNPFNVAPVTIRDSVLAYNSSSSTNISSITTTKDNCLALASIMMDSQSNIELSNLTQGYLPLDVSTGHQVQFLIEKHLHHAGASGDVDYSLSMQASGFITHFALNPASGGTGSVQVENSFGSLWNIYQATSNSLEARWSILQSVANSTRIDWSLLQQVISNTDINWSIFNSVNGATSIRWDLAGAVTSGLRIDWNLLQAASSAFSLDWNVLQQAQSGAELRFNVLQQAQNAIGIEFNIYSAVDRSFEISWDSLGSLNTINSSVRFDWSILNTVEAALQSEWSLLNSVGVSLELRHNISQQVAQAIETQYNILNSVSNSISLQWDSIEQINGVLSLSWSIQVDGYIAPVNTMVVLGENRVMTVLGESRVMKIN